jgi:hypothetical protein
MATHQPVTESYHVCTCGERFESTDELVAHAREEHGLWVH